MEKRRYALRLAYEGDAFRGWQRQPGMITVQGCLQEALSHLAGEVRLDAAARTDAGVHALDQVVTFSARAALDPARLRAEVNARTPGGLTCLEAAVAPPGFHARASARSRTYVYLVGWPPPPELARFAWALPDARAFPDRPAQRLDPARAADALARAVGEHDFAGLARPGEQTARRDRDPRATVRTVTRAEVVTAAERPLAAFVVEGHGFLRAMVRNLVGMAVAAGVGAERPERVSQLLAAPSVRYRGVRAPGWGLTLVRVAYPRSPFQPGAAFTAPR
ncbi:tRNA pseudouridine synthase A [Anaeromyxobacter diazotrophicus]|uniref:tRNA pseudouridine synthase A n=1 Tax=Anaeromyxobacter diazotrophicus TaxID=2590199 RepID=A0A7I9VLD8_9BACT|nr:tRNA pseudouridine synthase A [Anaeromyxobacter diazotrophicus]GEJ57225.1 tRNA pseudouridine synthase A [Anaeromyxobacter diazotrophicus]